MEKSILKKNVYICITESLCCIAEINTTLLDNYTSIKKKMWKKFSSSREGENPTKGLEPQNET